MIEKLKGRGLSFYGFLTGYFALGLILSGSFMPYIGIGNLTINFLSNLTYVPLQILFFLLLAGTAALLVLKQRRNQKGYWIAGSIFSLLNIAYSITEIIDIRNAKNEASGNLIFEGLAKQVHFGVGFYFIFAGGIILAASVIIFIIAGRIEPDDQDDLAPVTRRFSRKQIIGITAGVLAVAAAAGGLVLASKLKTEILPKSHYKKGKAAVKASDYETAVNEFRAAGNYEDSYGMLAEALCAVHYENGQAALEQEDFRLAYSEFAAAGIYEDAMELAASAETAAIYHEGLDLLESGDYDAAVEIFASIGDYEDSLERINEAYYLKANQLQENGEYLEAAENYSLSEGYEDSFSRIDEIVDALITEGRYEDALTVLVYGESSEADSRRSYCNAMIQIEEGNETAAISHLHAAGDIYDAPQLYQELSYNRGLSEFLDGDYDGAASDLNNAGDYADATDLVLVARAERYNRQGKLPDAISAYSQLSDTYTVDGFDAQGRRELFMSEQASGYTQYCGTFDASANDTTCRTIGSSGIVFDAWTVTRVMPNQQVNIGVSIGDDGSFNLTGKVTFYKYTNCSSWQSQLEGENATLYFNFPLTGSVAGTYELDDNTTLTISSGSAFLDYHYEERSSSLRDVFDSEVTYEFGV